MDDSTKEATAGALTASDDDMVAAEPYHVYNHKEKWFMVGIVALAGLFRCVVSRCCDAVFFDSLLTVQPPPRQHLLSRHPDHVRRIPQVDCDHEPDRHRLSGHARHL